MKRVLLLTIEYPPQQTGGIAEYIRNLKETVQDELKRHGGGSIHVLHQPLSSWTTPRWGGMFFRAFIRCLAPWSRPSCILVHHVWPIGIVAWFINAVFGTPYVIFFHGYDAALASSAKHFRKSMLERIIERSSLLVANSMATQRSIEKIGGSAVLRPIVLCYPCPSATPTDQQLARHSSKNSVTFLTVARLVKRKGVEHVMKAFAKLSEKHHGVRLVIVGDGPERSHLMALAKQHHVDGQVDFLGALSREKTAEQYAQADIFVMTPQDNWPDVEGFGMVYLEAALWGLPSIASDAGGVPEAVIANETGIIIPQDDVVAVTHAMEKLLNDPELRHRLGIAAQKRAMTEFTWRKQLTPVLTWITQL